MRTERKKVKANTFLQIKRNPPMLRITLSSHFASVEEMEIQATRGINISLSVERIGRAREREREDEI